MPDGSIIFETALDNKILERQYSDTLKKIQQLNNKIYQKTQEKLPLESQLDSVTKKLDEAKANLQMWKDEQASIQAAMAPGSSPDDYIEAAARQEQVNASLKEAEAEVAKLQQQWDGANQKVSTANAEMQRLTNELHGAEAAAGDIAQQLASAESAAATTAESTAGVAQETSSAEKSTSKMAASMERAQKSGDRFSRRLSGIVSSALVFSLVSRGLQSMRNWMWETIQTSDEAKEAIGRLKGALLTMVQPLVNVVIPAFTTFINILSRVVSFVASLVSSLFGMTSRQSAEAAKNLNAQKNAFGGVGSAAKEAKKQLMGFDEINQLSGDDTSVGGGGAGGTGGISPIFEDFSTAEYKAKIDELTAYLSGALLALGAILAFSGINIPLGITLMALGALGIASVLAQNWESMPENVRQAVTNVMLVLGTASLAIGVILCMSGANIPLGIGLMVAGAAALGTAVAVNWDYLTNALKGPIGKVTAIISGELLVLGITLVCTGVAIPIGIALIAAGAAGLVTAAAANWDYLVEALSGPIGKVTAIISGELLVLGIILVCTGVMLPLGVALIAAGAIGLVTVAAINWNAIQYKLKEVWSGIKSWFQSDVAPKLTLAYWQEKFSGIADALGQKIKSGINVAIAQINSFINWVNGAMHISWGGLSAFGQQLIAPGSMQLFSIPNIPYLAQGAVIPPNREFLAVLGDQKHGNNIEAPEDLIRKIVREETGGSGGVDVNISFDGDLAQLIRLLAPKITAQQKKTDRALGV